MIDNYKDVELMEILLSSHDFRKTETMNISVCTNWKYLLTMDVLQRN